MAIRCVQCGSNEVGMYIELRRYYSPDHLDVDVDGTVEYYGWGNQVDDEIDYLECNGCGAIIDPEELKLAPMTERGEDGT